MMKIRFGVVSTLLIGLWASAVVAEGASDAMNAPSKHAWDLFVRLNHPADLSAVRGTPDTSKKIGDEGLTVWETWKSAGSEVFLPDGSEPLAWSAQEENASSLGIKTFDLPKAISVQALSSGMSIQEVVDPHILLEEVEPDGEFGRGGGETRMNRATFDFIVENSLYNIEGQEAMYRDIVTLKKPKLSFPEDSIEVKAMWIRLTDDDVSSGKAGRYHQGFDGNGQRFGLVALHILTKDVPNWFWCSFRQVDGPEPRIPSVDTVGRPGLLDGTKWAYYELSGTQTEFTDSLGRPNLLSDPHVEAGFERSSCITCHAMSTIGAPSDLPRGDRLPFTGIGTGDLGTPIGIPPTDLFFDETGAQKYIQLDFVFSLSFRANRRQTESLTSNKQHVVEIFDFKFVPATISIRRGDSVVWRNMGDHNHSAVRLDTPSFDTGIVAPGETSNVIVIEVDEEAEELEYYCAPHPFMKGKMLIVRE